jgi:hypothetical protein
VSLGLQHGPNGSGMIVGCAKKRFVHGLLLVDLVIYLALVSFLLILAAVVFDRFLTQSADLRRNISDIEQALKAGERWRADIRAATAAPQLLGNTMIIPLGTGELTYTFGTNVTRRRTSSEVIETIVGGVKTNQFFFEQRAHAGVWRWELELESRRKSARVRPLFTLIAVAGSK